MSLKQPSYSDSRRIKILQEDRKSFLKVCKIFSIPDAELIFDSAQSNESPVDLDDLLSSVGDDLLQRANGYTILGEILEKIFGSEYPDISGMIWKKEFDLEKILELYDQQQLQQKQQSMTVPEESGERISMKILRERDERILELEQELEQKKLIVPLPILPPLTIQVDVGTVHIMVEEEVVLDQVVVPEAPPASVVLVELENLREALADRESEIRTLGEKIENMESMNFLDQLAAKQAQRDSETARLQLELDEVCSRQVTEVVKPPSPVVTSAMVPQSETLKDENTRIFRKNIFIKFLSYSMVGDYGKMHHMIPLVKEVFELTPAEASDLDKLCVECSDGFWRRN